MTLRYVYFQNPRPLYSFEDNGDYVYDVQWSPIHPALFAAVDGTGRLDLWNLNNDTEVKLGINVLLLISLKMMSVMLHARDEF